MSNNVIIEFECDHCGTDQTLILNGVEDTPTELFCPICGEKIEGEGD